MDHGTMLFGEMSHDWMLELFEDNGVQTGLKAGGSATISDAVDQLGVAAFATYPAQTPAAPRRRTATGRA